ncbi:HDOD domain-containing protein [Thioalkalivibrio sp.]|uniref:HDOD domain-containing protein n=1 Tax=Thioalkalivibrio sp. TaxID=2093813 RepID=UPI003976E5A7
MAQSKRANDFLPSLPQLLVRILDAVQDDRADLEDLSERILQDAGITARIIAVANSSFYYRGKSCDSLDRAILSLGTDAIKTLVMTAAMKQLFGQFNQNHPHFLKQVWRNALVTASLSQVLAVLTGYARPDEAYLSGLLVDIGRLARLSEDETRYLAMLEAAADDRALVHAERDTYGTNHCEVAASLMEDWGLGPFLVDAVRYHLEPAPAVRDAHHLVKLVNLAYALGRPGPVADDTLAAADILFALNEGLTEELRGRVGEDVARLAGSLHIDIDAEGEWDQGARRSLSQRLEDLNRLTQLQGELAQTPGILHQRRALQRVLFLTFGVEQSLLFLVDEDQAFLRVWLDGEEEPAFVLPLETGRSLVADAVLEDRSAQVTSDGLDALPVADRQIFALCGKEAMWVEPLRRESGAFGAMLLGVDHAQLASMMDRSGFVRAMGREITRALAATPGAGSPAPDGEGLERRIREMVHEAGNPLSIIQNYLAMLRVKLGEQHDAQEELGVIREEIERVGRILLRMREAPEQAEGAPVSLNREVRQITDIFAASVCSARNITLEVDLAANDPLLGHPPDHLRQILTNLLKNACEALDDGGAIRVMTRDPVNLDGRQYTELLVRDNGPGLPQEVMARLFSPVQSTKGEGHSGLGLSIVKRLVDEMDGIVLCSSGSTGTRFQVLLPRAVAQ